MYAYIPPKQNKTKETNRETPELRRGGGGGVEKEKKTLNSYLL